MKLTIATSLTEHFLKKHHLESWKVKIVPQNQLSRNNNNNSQYTILGQIHFYPSQIVTTKEILLWNKYIKSQSVYNNTQNILHEIAHVILVEWLNRILPKQISLIIYRLVGHSFIWRIIAWRIGMDPWERYKKELTK